MTFSWESWEAKGERLCHVRNEGLANQSRGGAFLAGKPGPGSLKRGGEAQAVRLEWEVESYGDS